MGLLDKVERGIEKAVRGVFSTGSRAQVEPVEIASRLRREVDHKAITIAAGRTLAPNVFDVQLSDDDFKRAQEWGTPLAEELCDVVINHVRSQGYTLQGPVRISFRRAEEMRAGDFEIASYTEKPRARPEGLHHAPTFRLLPAGSPSGSSRSWTSTASAIPSMPRPSSWAGHQRPTSSWTTPGCPRRHLEIRTDQRHYQGRGPGIHQRQLRQRTQSLRKHRTYRRLHHHDGTDKDHLPPVCPPTPVAAHE